MPADDAVEVQGEGEDKKAFQRSHRLVLGSQLEPTVFNPRQVYAGCSLFAGCSPEFFDVLEAESDEISRVGQVFHPGDVVVAQGEPAHSAFVVFRGHVEVLDDSKRTSQLGEGDFFGEGALLGLELIRPVTVRALSMCHLFEVQGVAFAKALARFRTARILFERFHSARVVKRQVPDVVSPTRRASRASSGNLDIGPGSPSARRRRERGRSGPRTSTAEDEAFMLRLEKSLQSDMRRNVHMPPLGEAVDAFGSIEGVKAGDNGLDLDLRLLPPLCTMIPVQKKSVHKVLEARMNWRSLQRRTTDLGAGEWKSTLFKRSGTVRID
mmetsp:Transcript_16285/g.35645  ORF Transcript_16285/g.35645 Transcript_16285/m.35645 type:complete len:324 (+) Transcript_16285:87-1058(+)